MEVMMKTMMMTTVIVMMSVMFCQAGRKHTDVGKCAAVSGSQEGYKKS